MRWHVAVAVVGAAVIATMVLVAWAAHAPGLYAPWPSHQAMVPVSAVLALLLAAGLASRARVLVALAAAAVAVLAVWVLAAHYWSWDFPPARPLFYSRVVGGGPATAALPSVPTATAALLLAGALFAEVARRRRVVLVLSAVALMLSSVLLLGHVTSLESLYGAGPALQQRGVSLWSSVVFTALSSAVLCPRLPTPASALLYGTGSFPRTFRAAGAAAVVAPVLTWAVMAAWGRHLLPTADERLAAIVIVDAVVVALVAGALLIRLQRVQQDNVRSLQDAAHTDELTGLANRRALFDRGGELLAAARTGVGVVVIDIDGLKRVNDELGHAAGDTLLRAAAHRLRAAVRAGDVTARLGGDEFAVLTTAHDPEELVELAARIASHLTGPVAGLGSPAVLEASVGTAFGRGGDPAALPTLLATADEHMYAQKTARDARR